MTYPAEQLTQVGSFEVWPQAPTHVKIEREVAAWQWGSDFVPDYVLEHIKWVPKASRFGIVSPASGHASELEPGNWIIQAVDTGCFYVVTNDAFQRKYRPLP